MFILVDCNNFYASCERLFRPDLWQRPIIVLSNNDGCVIARSKEAKALGIGMGDPFFQCEAIVKKYNVAVFSSNFSLYGRISARLMTFLKMRAPSVECYSIDEAFLYFPDLSDPTQQMVQLRKDIQRCIGIPVSIGIAETKTLAKLANHVAKKSMSGVYHMPSDNDMLLKTLPVSEVWGIGRAHQRSLKNRGVQTVYDLKYASETLIRRQYKVTGYRTQKELQGCPCLSIEDDPAPKKMIVSSRSFSQKITDIDALKNALIQNIMTATEKSRKGNQKSAYCTIFIATSPHSDNYYSCSVPISLPEASDNPWHFIAGLEIALQTIYMPQYRYAKSGVVLHHLIPNTVHQGHLFSCLDPQRSLLSAMDTLNHRYGRGTVGSAASYFLHRPWAMQQRRKSPAYMTSWDALPVVYAR